MTELDAAASLILVVEDQALLRLEAVDLLQEAGFETLEALDAHVALTIMEARGRAVRLLFTDVQMPGSIDGIDLAEEVHRHWPDVLLLVTSGDVAVREDDLPDHGKFVAKPYEASTLVRQVRDLIEEGSAAR